MQSFYKLNTSNKADTTKRLEEMATTLGIKDPYAALKFTYKPATGDIYDKRIAADKNRVLALSRRNKTPEQLRLQALKQGVESELWRTRETRLREARMNEARLRETKLNANAHNLTTTPISYPGAAPAAVAPFDTLRRAPLIPGS